MVDEREKAFTAHQEKIILNLLKRMKTISLQDIRPIYSSTTMARGVYGKLIGHGLAKIKSAGVLEYIEKEELPKF